MMDKVKVLLSFPGILGTIPFLIIIILVPFNGFSFYGSEARIGISGTSAQNPAERVAKVVNDSGYRLELRWVHPNTGEMSLVSSPNIGIGEAFTFNSFELHKFQISEVPDAKSKQCGGEDKTCRVNWMTVNQNHDQVFTIKGNFTVDHRDSTSLAPDFDVEKLHQCQERQLKFIQRNTQSMSPDSATKIIDEMVDCIGPSIADRFEKLNDELAFQASVRTKMAAQLENYTCADDDSAESEPVDIRTWTIKGNDYRVRVLLDRNNSKIHNVDDFITGTECEAVEKAAKRLLHQATVADSNGGSQLSENRKAMQAGIQVPWAKESSGDPIAVLSRRVFDYTNWVTGLNLQEHGQEDLMSIQYFGRGEQEKKPDRYMPHCDGSCEGQPHKEGGRIATMVMYCEVADKGGATNFRNSFVNVKAKKGGAVFFSYVGDELIMDNGFTEHSGCPVIHGEKKIVTQWMRLGVDAENPWDAWNTLGVKITDTLND